MWQYLGMDRSTVFGLIIGFGGILLGNFFEGGHIASLAQGTAFLIVVTGTMGAVLISNKTKDIKIGMQLFKQSFLEQNLDYDHPIAEIVECARLSKKETILSLEAKLNQLKSPMLKDVLRNVIDGVDSKLTKQIFDNIIYIHSNFFSY